MRRHLVLPVATARLPRRRQGVRRPAAAGKRHLRRGLGQPLDSIHRDGRAGLHEQQRCAERATVPKHRLCAHAERWRLSAGTAAVRSGCAGPAAGSCHLLQDQANGHRCDAVTYDVAHGVADGVAHGGADRQPDCAAADARARRAALSAAGRLLQHFSGALARRDAGVRGALSLLRGQPRQPLRLRRLLPSGRRLLLPRLRGDRGARCRWRASVP